MNRVSLGVQSFDDNALEWMHRTHDAARVATAASARWLTVASTTGRSISSSRCRPPLAETGRGDVERAVALAPPHISLYGLTVEAHTPIAHWRDRGDAVEGTEDAYETEYLHADRALTAAGYTHYEVSNFGRPTRFSRHNRGYWTGASYVGLGPAAHGFDGITRRWNEREYAAWLSRIGENRLTRSPGSRR